MKLVVDANIVFSALLNSDGEVGKLLVRTWPTLDLFAPEALRVELAAHRNKIMRLSGFSSDELVILEDRIFERITVVPSETIPSIVFEHAYELVKDVDERDDHYIALSLHLGSPLWTGDKKLIAGLRRKGFKLLMTSEELRKKLA